MVKARETKLQAIIAELSEISQRRERELAEMDRIAKMLVRRDFELSEIREKREKELSELDRAAKLLIRRDLELSGAIVQLEKQRNELDRIAKILVRRDLELTEMREEQVKELQEMDRIAKMLVRRDFELAEIREKRERELQELEKRTKELEESRTALMNILEDVEEARKKAEEEKEKTLAVITNFTDGLLVFDRENKLSLINPQAENFFDVKGRNIIGRPVLELSTFPTLEPLVRLVGKEIKQVFRKELPIKEKFTLEVSTVPMVREEEKIGTMVILHDISREKMVERMKTEFVSLAAHQLRTPLSAIKWTLRMLLDGDLGKITEEQRDFIEKTYGSNERMIALINDLLDVTRIEEGRYLYKPTLADFEPICQFVINSFKEEIEKRKIKFEFKKPEKKLPQVKVDVEKIRLAIQNLLDNAIKYTQPEGKVTITLKSGKKEVEFSIRDSGVGIPSDQQERVFSKFFRGANVLRMETEGSGLGLFIAKNIIEAHNGKIWFESEEGKGTIFYFTLPVEKEFEDF
ncbi:MAG: ATP-binding protein [Patescibacteria group bacterium]|nr:ATP-binding protein [Patescibacteria group bacterium]